MKFIKRLFLIVILCAVSALAAFYVAGKFMEPERIYIDKPVEVEKVVEKQVVLTADTVESSIQDIGLLCTADYYFSHVEKFDSTKTIPFTVDPQTLPRGFEWLSKVMKKDIKIPGTKSSFIYSYDGNILAGIDFTKVKVEMEDDGDEVTVFLPKADIISTNIDQDSFELYDEKNNIFNPITVTDFADSYRDMVKDEEQKAISTGLLDRADANAQTLMTNLIKGLANGKDMKIVFAAAE